jgi:hypothetical protein
MSEAISYLPNNKEIAALPAGTRNDEKIIAAQSFNRYDKQNSSAKFLDDCRESLYILR